MKKFVLLFFLLIFSLASFLKPNPTFAFDNCSSDHIDISASPNTAYTGSGSITVTFVVEVGGSASLDLNDKYYISLASSADFDRKSDPPQTITAGSNTFTITVPKNTNANWKIDLRNSKTKVICQDGDYQSTKKVPVIHCSNGTKDADETGVDCGGIECIACAATTATGVGVTAPPPATCPLEFGTSGVPTGLGCIPTQPDNLVRWLLKYAILMGGGIAFLLSVWGGITILLAAGNPEKINEGKEIIGSAITGLMFIILSVFLLRLIGFDILKLPGFDL